MGLGLAISRSIVAAHEGTLSAERNVGFGTTFMVTLPLNQRYPNDSRPSCRVRGR